jgi:HEXXH motif-containing protein
MLPVVPERVLTELGRTEGGPGTLGLLVRDQHTRRLLLLRAVLDATEAADAGVCPPAARARLREDWALLEEADRVTPRAAPKTWGYADAGAGTPAGEAGSMASRSDGIPMASRSDGGPMAFRRDDTPPTSPGGAASMTFPRGGAPAGSLADGARPACWDGGSLPASLGGASAASPDDADPAGAPLSPVRARLLHPFVGPWARNCLRGLRAGGGSPTERDAHELGRDLAYFGALAAAAAVRAGVSFAVRLTARDGVLTLPSLGALRTAVPGDTPVDVVHRRNRLTLRRPGEADIVVHPQSGIGAWSGSPAWTPAHALPGLLPGSAPLPLDDLDPYRTVRGGPRHHALSGPVALDDAERKHWLHAWSGTAAVLEVGGAQRLAEAVALLRCLVPLSAPPGTTHGGRPGGSCSGTRREAFGAVLSSAPATATAFAATLVHELQHAKLAALSDVLTLHHGGPEARYFAPWRPDPRPYDGLLQGAYSHLALADFFQRSALATTSPARRDAAWSQHARYRQQVGAVLPALVGSGDLTPQGRRFVDQMVGVYERLADHPAPRGQTARAQAYVRAARALWTQRHAQGE